MRESRIARHVMLVLIPLMLSGCEQSQRREQVTPTGEAQQSRQSEPAGGIAWNHIRSGIGPVDVLQLLGEPNDVKVTKVSTTWYYSDRGSNGPYVIFDTRGMTVDTWREPVSR